MTAPPERARVLVAMSGGVDSSVAAALLVEAGYDVVGATLHLWDYPDDGSVRGRCCAPEDQYDARRTADRLGIAHFSFDRRADFAAKVVGPFVDAYLRGETPSPCVACNRGVKTRELFDLADRLGASHVATGHYARVVREGPGRRPWLARARDLDKDQSYFLHALGPDELARAVFPLGERTKAEVRARARALGLPGADKGESQELCFVPTGRYDAFVAARADGRVRPGPILDGSGREVGRHEGLHRFTVGQRKGLGVALGAPAYVVGLDPERAAVRLGPAEALDCVGLEADEGAFGPEVPERFRALVKVRARHEGAEAEVERGPGGRVVLRFSSPVRAVSVGQYAVAYLGDRVAGGARIVKVSHAHAPEAKLGAPA
ncbi:MAG TPA: tRNA 2-thiouridine(34) synthase MnmA [Polyangiaceae bacterium]|nr:tRNA 2-thiouridine(34) synthase MnmA [Polyangiaceae bacterium]